MTAEQLFNPFSGRSEYFIMICTGLRNMPELCVFIAPGLESHDDGFKGSAAWGQAVFHLWRNFRINRP